MKNIIPNIQKFFFIIIILLVKNVFAQNTYPYALETVTFNAETKRVDKIPFDKPFKLEIENFTLTSIHKIFIYEMTLKDGVRCFVRNYADIEIPGDSIKRSEKKIWFIMPALKPQKHFDVVIISKETDPFNKAIELNKAILNSPADRNLHEVLFSKLKKSYDLASYCNLPTSSFVPGTLDDYLDLYNQGINKVMLSIIKFESIRTTNTINESKFEKLMPLSKLCCKNIDSAAMLNFYDNSTKVASMERIYRGLIRLSDYIKKEVDPFDLQTRIQNLESSIKTVGVIELQVKSILNSIQGGDKSLLNDLEIFKTDLEHNKEVLLNQYKQGTSLLEGQFYSNNNLLSTTVSKDLQTESNNRFLLDLGLANLRIKDNRNNFAYIPKLSYGVNILLRRPVDKNVPLSSLPGSLKNLFDRNIIIKKGEDRQDTLGLLAKKSVWHYVSFYLGFTIGEITEPEFGDFYNKTSLMIGPSIRIYRAFRISFGPSFLKRVSVNPVMTRKEIVTGMFATASVDLDLLKAINSIINPLTPSLK